MSTGVAPARASAGGSEGAPAGGSEGVFAGPYKMFSSSVIPRKLLMPKIQPNPFAFKQLYDPS